MDVKTIIHDLIKTKSLQEFINRRFKSDGKQYVIDQYKYVVQIDDIKFWLDDMYDAAESVNTYSTNDIRKDDIVLDIGANIGGFSLKIADSVSHVYAVEPLFNDRLKHNIELNNINNITIIDYPLGDIDIEFMGYRKKIKGKSLSELIQLCGGHIDFLKLDCEGGEWNIKPHELEGIRRIEMELHNNLKPNNAKDFEEILKESGFIVESTQINWAAKIVHASRK